MRRNPSHVPLRVLLARRLVRGFVVASWLDGIRGRISDRLLQRLHPARVVDQELTAAGVPIRSRSTGFRDIVLFNRLSDPSQRWAYPGVMAGPDPAQLRPPMVLATFQVGATGALGALLERLPAEVLALVGGRPQTRGNLRTFGLSGGELPRVAALKAGVDALRAGHFVFVVIGEQGSAHVEATLFGRRISLAGGAFALSRMTNAPILPVAAHWRGPRIEIVAGEPVPSGDGADMAAALMGWLERYLREHPQELGMPLADQLRRA